MGKNLCIPACTNATDIIDRSDIGNLTDCTSYIDASNVTMSCIHDTLSEDNYCLSQLASSNSINKYALFKPGRLAVNGSVFCYCAPGGGSGDPYNMGDFLGYNHEAHTPSLSFSTTCIGFSCSGQIKNISVPYNMGEVAWQTEVCEINYLNLFVCCTGAQLCIESRCLADAMGIGSFNFNHTTTQNSDYSIWIEGYFSNTSNGKNVPVPVNPCMTVCFDFVSQPKVSGVIIDQTGLDTCGGTVFYFANTCDECLFDSCCYSYHVQVFQSNGGVNPYNDTWDMYALNNGCECGLVKDNCFVNSCSGGATITGSLPFNPTLGDTVSFRYEAS